MKPKSEYKEGPKAKESFEKAMKRLFRARRIHKRSHPSKAKKASWPTLLAVIGFGFWRSQN